MSLYWYTRKVLFYIWAYVLLSPYLADLEDKSLFFLLFFLPHKTKSWSYLIVWSESFTVLLLCIMFLALLFVELTQKSFLPGRLLRVARRRIRACTPMWHLECMFRRQIFITFVKWQFKSHTSGNFGHLIENLVYQVPHTTISTCVWVMTSIRVWDSPPNRNSCMPV